MHRDTVWEFETARFRVALEIEPEDMDPADHFEFAEHVAMVRNGDVEWFQAIVAVYLKVDGVERKIAWDSLGGCAYRRVSDFFIDHRDSNPMNRNCSIMRAARGGNVSICHYFPDMVREAVRQARDVLADMPRLRVA